MIKKILIKYNRYVVLTITTILLCVSPYVAAEEIVDNDMNSNKILNVIDVATSTDKIVISILTDGRLKSQKGQLAVVSLQECVELKRYILKEPLKNITIPSNNTDIVWGSVKGTLIKWNIKEGKEEYTFDLVDGTIEGIYLTKDSNLFVWGADKIMMINTSSDEPYIVWSASQDYSITDIAVDEINSDIYLGGKDGSFGKIDYKGKNINTLVLEGSINSIDINVSNKLIYLAMSNGLLRYDITKHLFLRMANIPIDDVMVSTRNSDVYILANSIYSVYSQPESHLIHTSSLLGKQFNTLGNFGLVTFNDYSVTILDKLSNKIIVTILLNSDTLGFIAPDNNYYGDALFRSSAINGDIKGISSYIVQNRAPSAVNTCGSLKKIILQGYLPEELALTTDSNNIPSKVIVTKKADIVATPLDNKTTKPATEAKVKQIKELNNPILPLEIEAELQGEEGEISDTKSSNSKIDSIVNIPQVIPSEVFAMVVNTPDWVDNKTSLPSYSSVQKDKSSKEALNKTKIAIREDIARSVMKNMLQTPYVENINIEELKKKFLWMVAGKTAKVAQNYVIQRDIWRSDKDEYYLYGYVSLETVQQIYNTIYNNEVKQLEAYGLEAYLSIEPVKWE